MVSSFLLGKLALVTGGSGTIGQAIAKTLAEAGAAVIICGRNETKLNKARESILEALPSGQVSCISADVTQEDSVKALFEAIDDEHGGGLDLLINNAGTSIPGATADLTAGDLEYTLKVNVVGPFICAREAIARMKQNGGRIINIGSLSSSTPRPDTMPYTVSKFAIRGLTQSLALDVRRHGNISVGIINPGNVLSDLLTPEQIAGRQDTEGFMNAQDVADSVLTMANLPYSTSILDMTILPTRQPFVGRG